MISDGEDDDDGRCEDSRASVQEVCKLRPRCEGEDKRW
jgi:hypothetical protein